MVGGVQEQQSGLECSSVVEYLPTMQEALGLTTGPLKEKVTMTFIVLLISHGGGLLNNQHSSQLEVRVADRWQLGPDSSWNFSYSYVL